jgi:hypothetical protein
MPGNSSMSPNTTGPRESIAIVGGKPALPSDELDRVGPSKRRRGGFWGSNWLSFALLLPALVMNLARVPLGISDAFLVGPDSDTIYNLCMFLAFFLGGLACLAHTLVLPLIKGHGWGWVVPKLIFVGAVWYAVWYSFWVVSRLLPPPEM